MTTFNLIDEPWIRVRLGTGEIAEVSLPDVFARAHEITALAGELPTQDAAVLRVLLAILRRSHPEARGTEAWGALWTRSSYDAAPINAYLEKHRERFDLLHPVTPFFQVADLHTAKGEFTELARLIADVPAGFAYFTTRAGDALNTMTFAEATRWLIHCQAFDPSGIKSGAVGDERVKGGKGYPIGTGWCGRLGLVVLEGANLFETLLLNSPIAKRDSDPANDRPVWELETQTAATTRLRPTGPADLQTWQLRRLRLDHDGKRATAVLIANGDPLHASNRFGDEFMTSWRNSEAQKKAQKSPDDVYMPREHLPDRAIWRGLAGLLATGEAGASGKPGRWLTWLGDLRGDEELARSTAVGVRTIGMIYGAQSSTTADVVDDRLQLDLAVLADPVLRAQAVDAVADADKAVRFVASLGGELAQAAGASGDLISTARSRAREQGYEALDHPYRQWLRGLSADSDSDAARLHWQEHLRRTLAGVVHDLIVSAGPAAWTGREETQGDKTYFHNAGHAEAVYRYNMRTTFPVPSPSQGDAV